MKLAATSILALALAAPAVTAQTTEDRPSSTTMSPKKEAASPTDKTMPQAGTAAGSSTTSDRGSLSTSSSSTTSDRNVATSSDTMANDKECKCDCSKQGAMKSTK